MKAVPLTFRCTADWDRMTPRAGGRFCGDCQKVVHNLTAMGEDAAQALLRANTKGELCVRYATGADGTVLFAPAAQPLIPSSILLRAKRAALAASLALPLAACSSEPGASSERLVTQSDAVPAQADAGPAPDAHPDWNMGGVAYMPQTPEVEADAGADSAVDASAQER